MNIGSPSNNFFQLPGMRRPDDAAASSAPGEKKRQLRIPLIGFLPNRIRNHFIAMVGEFLGTFLFLFFAFAGTQVANASAAAATNGNTSHAGASLAQAPNAGTLLYISLVFGFSLAVNAWVFFRISGGLFNPAVTLGMALIGAVPWVRASLVFIAQLCGSMASAGIVSALFPGPLNVSTTLNGTTSIARGLFIEMFLTFELVFTIFMLAAEKHKGTFLAPVGIGLALFIAELAGVYFTGGSLNPARSFGPCVANKLFPGYHWIYWVGPALGAVLAAGFYRFVKMIEYETANPGQDFNEKEAEVFEFDEDTGRASDVARPNVQAGVPDANIEQLVTQSSRDGNQGPGLGGSASDTGKLTSADAFHHNASGGSGALLGSPGNEKTHTGIDGAGSSSEATDQVFRTAALAEEGELGNTYQITSSPKV